MPLWPIILVCPTENFGQKGNWISKNFFTSMPFFDVNAKMYCKFLPQNQHGKGKSPFSIGHASSNGEFSIATLVFRGGKWFALLSEVFRWVITCKPPIFSKSFGLCWQPFLQGQSGFGFHVGLELNGGFSLERDPGSVCDGQSGYLGNGHLTLKRKSF